MASHKFEDLKKRCEGLKFDPMTQPRVGLTFIMLPDLSIIDREASIRATLSRKVQTYVIAKDFEIVVRKIIAKLFCNVYKYVIQIKSIVEGAAVMPKYFSATLYAYYAGGKIDPLKLIKEFKRLANYNQEWRALSKMVHAVVVEKPDTMLDDGDRQILEEDGVDKPDGFPEFETGGWCCWKNNSLKNNTGLVFSDPEEVMKNNVEASLFSNEIFASSQTGTFKRLFEYSEKKIPNTNVSVSSNNIKKKETVTLNDPDSFDDADISFVPKKSDVRQVAYFNGGYNKPKNKKLPAEHQEIIYGNKNKNKKALTPEQIQKMNDEIEAYETSINKEA